MPLSISSSEAAQPLRPATALHLLAVAVLVMALALGAATEWLVRTQVLPQDTRAKHLALLQSANSPDAAFGDSHVARGFDARDGFVNLAYPSENIELIFDKVQEYYSDKSPGRVILQADPHLFAPYRLAAASPARTSGPDPWLHSATPRHRPRLTAYWTSFFKGGGVLTSKVTQTPNGALLSQGNFAALPERRQLYDARYRLAIHQIAGGPAVAAARQRYAEMVRFLSDQGADLCLVSFPVTPAYLTALDRKGQPAGHTEAIAFFTQTAAAQGARYVDARAHVLDPTLFRDVDHLNVEGAKQFADPLINACFAAAS